ncbi:MAG: CheR family methyltransferase, partial [candidate division NC10 bacterium]
MKREQETDLGWPKATLDALVDAMRQAHGRDLSQFDESFLIKSIEKRLAATACGTAAAYLERLADDRAEAEALCDSLRIGYSEFFRDPLTFALLERVVLPALVQEKSGGPEIRIWSAGCAAGQEAYSVAILLEELATLRERPVPFRIFATDVSEADLAVARNGVYDHAAVQKVRLRHLRDYFSAKGEIYVVAPRLRDRVDFSTYDLLDE